MRITGINQNVLLRFLLIPAILLAVPTLVYARVAGPCANCHTMHNSQNNAEQVIIGDNTSIDVGWTPGGAFQGTAVDVTAQDYLLKTDCVGCHSSPSSGPNTRIIDMGGNASFKVPIVWNIGDTGNSASDLAGGNFSYVATLGDEYGHNVLGISGRDGNFLTTPAPGFSAGKGCLGSCHESLAIPVAEGGIPESGADENGCKGCHLWTGHHDPMVVGGSGPGNTYRFLGGHGGTEGFNMPVDNVDGALESFDWGLTETNVYLGQGADYAAPTTLVIGRFCAGCHHKFHAVGGIDEMLGEDNKGSRDTTDSTPWLRHPTNVNIGSSNDFDELINSSLAYGEGLPLARTLWQNRTAAIGTTDQVMCLSCHMAHGSQYPDALRWDYTQTIAHDGVESTTGCFYCHRTKDT